MAATTTSHVRLEEEDEGSFDDVSLTWVGKPSEGLPRKAFGSALVKKYPAVRVKLEHRDEFICGQGDFVHLRAPEEDEPPYVARMIDLYASAGKKYATVQWMYRPEDVGKSALPKSGGKGKKKAEILYASEHLDRVELETLLEVFRVELTLVSSSNTQNIVKKSALYSDSMEEVDDVNMDQASCKYHCSRIYDIPGKKVSLLTEALWTEIEDDVYSNRQSTKGSSKKKRKSEAATSTTKKRQVSAQDSSRTHEKNKVSNDSQEAATQNNSPSSNRRKSAESIKVVELNINDDEQSITDGSKKGENSDSDESSIIFRGQSIRKNDNGKKKKKKLTEEPLSDESISQTPVRKRLLQSSPHSNRSPSYSTYSKKKRHSSPEKTSSISDGDNEIAVAEKSESPSASKNGQRYVDEDHSPPLPESILAPYRKKIEDRSRLTGKKARSEKLSDSEDESITEDEVLKHPSKASTMLSKTTKKRQDIAPLDFFTDPDVEIINDSLPPREASMSKDSSPLSPSRKPATRSTFDSPSLNTRKHPGVKMDIDGAADESPKLMPKKSDIPVKPTGSDETNALSEVSADVAMELSTVTEKASNSLDDKSSTKAITSTTKRSELEQSRLQFNKSRTRSTNVDIPKLPDDVDEQLWDLLQQYRFVGKHPLAPDSLELLGYLKLELICLNDGTQIQPPHYISNLMRQKELVSFTAKARELLKLPSTVQKTISPTNMRASFAELERLRPGAVFDRLGYSTDLSRLDVRRPMFGSLIGIDGFKTIKVLFNKQTMYVPIECREGDSVRSAVIRGIANLATPEFSFSVFRIADCEYGLALTPDETSDQIFVRMANGRAISLQVPLEKGLLGFVNALLCGYEDILPYDQKLVFENKRFRSDSEDKLRLKEDCGMQPFMSMYLVSSTKTQQQQLVESNPSSSESDGGDDGDDGL